MEAYSDALKFASAAHEGQKRKINGDPYITHPIAVAAETARLGDLYNSMSRATTPHVSIDIMEVAALLHDVVEDTHVELDEIYDTFGQHVGHLVHYLTHDEESSSRLDYISKILSGPTESQIIKIADLTHNLSTWSTDTGSWVEYRKLTRYILENNVGLPITNG
jgi:(p)ppGpp synthase/HD superfamily hydrolase